MHLLRFIKNNKRPGLFLIIFLFSLYSTYLYFTVGQRGYDNVLVVLSQQFLKGHLALPIYNLPIRDISNYYNNFYVYFGPLASILLMPFVLVFGKSFPQASIGFFTLISSFIAIYFISRKFLFDKIIKICNSAYYYRSNFQLYLYG